MTGFPSWIACAKGQIKLEKGSEKLDKGSHSQRDVKMGCTHQGISHDSRLSSTQIPTTPTGTSLLPPFLTTSVNVTTATATVAIVFGYVSNRFEIACKLVESSRLNRLAKEGGYPEALKLARSSSPLLWKSSIGGNRATGHNWSALRSATELCSCTVVCTLTHQTTHKAVYACTRDSSFAHRARHCERPRLCWTRQTLDRKAW